MFQTLTIGNGTATINDKGTLSDFHSVRLRGAGHSIVTIKSEYTTTLKWVGPAGAKMVVVQGPINGVELSNLRIDGNSTSGDVLTLLNGDEGRYVDLRLGFGQADTTGLVLHNGTFKNLFENVDIFQQASGASALKLGENADPSSFGLSQNVFVRCRFNHAANTDTSYGIYLEAADNNSFYQVVTEANLIQVTAATNATPITITTNLDHLRSTGDTINIAGVQGNTAANGTHTITVLSATTFELDSSSGNGTYTSGGRIRGPGHGLFFERMAPPNGLFPHENAFYNSAFLRGFVTSNGTHGPNVFLPYPSSDLELLDANAGSGASQLVGIAHPDYVDNIFTDHMRFIGKYSFVRDDNSTEFAKFFSDTGRVVIGDIGTFIPSTAGLTIRKDAANASLDIRSTSVGNAILNLQTDGNALYQMIADRATNSFKLVQGANEFLTYNQGSQQTALGGLNLDLKSGATPTSRLSVPSDGGLRWISASEQSCDAAHRGTVNYVAGGAGSADTFRICRKTASDTYGWANLY